MAENGIIYVAFYAELYILISIVLLLKTKVDLCNPAFIFWSAYTVLLGLGPVVYGFYRSNFVFVYNYYLVILAPLAAFVLGNYVLSCSKKPKGRDRHIRTYPFDRNIVLLVAYVVGVGAGALFLLRSGLSFTTSDFESSRITAQSGMGPYLYLNGMLVLVVPLLFDQVLKARFPKKTFMLLTAMAITIFLCRGSRTLAILPFAIMALQYLTYKKMKLGVHFSLLVFGVIVLVTASVLRGTLNSEASLGDYFVNFFGVLTYNLNTQFKFFPDRIDYMLGSTFFMSFNLLLPGAGQDFTMWLKEAMGQTFAGGGVTPSIVGEFYINFGMVGVFCGMFIMGGVANFLEEIAQKSFRHRVFVYYLIVQLALVVYGGFSTYLLSLSLNTIAYFAISLLSSGDDLPESYRVEPKGLPYAARAADASGRLR